MSQKPRLQLVTVVLLASLVAGLVSWILSAKLEPKVNPPSRYELIQRAGTIRAGYYVGAPYFTLDPRTGDKGGIFYEIVEKAAAKLQLNVEWPQEVGFGEMAESLNRGRLDIIGSGIWINAARATSADFTIPVLYDVVGAFVRVDDNRFDNTLERVNSPNVKISTIDGEMAATIAATDFPRASVVSLPQLTDFTQMILQVVEHKADITFLGLAPALNYQAANQGQIRAVKTSDNPIRIFPNAIMLPQGEFELKRALDLALTEMLNNGEIEKIIQKYEEQSGSHFRVRKDYVIPREYEGN